MALTRRPVSAAAVALNTSTATQITTGNPDGGVVVIQNEDATHAIRIGDSSITTSRGLYLAPSSTQRIPFVDGVATEPWYAIAVTGTPSVTVLEIK